MKAAKMKKVLCLVQLANVSKTGAFASPDVKYVVILMYRVLLFSRQPLCFTHLPVLLSEFEYLPSFKFQKILYVIKTVMS